MEAVELGEVDDEPLLAGGAGIVGGQHVPPRAHIVCQVVSGGDTGTSWHLDVLNDYICVAISLRDVDSLWIYFFIVV